MTDAELKAFFERELDHVDSPTCDHVFGKRNDDGTLRIEVSVRGDGTRYAECTKCLHWVPVDKEVRNGC